jgi:hypothetical protein
MKTLFVVLSVLVCGCLISCGGVGKVTEGVKKAVRCKECQGTGECQQCGGYGATGLLGLGGTCKNCKGSGRCPNCKGAGW